MNSSVNLFVAVSVKDPTQWLGHVKGRYADVSHVNPSCLIMPLHEWAGLAPSPYSYGAPVVGQPEPAILQCA